MKHKQIELPHLEYDEIFKRYGQVLTAARMRSLEEMVRTLGCPMRAYSMSDMLRELYADTFVDVIYKDNPFLKMLGLLEQTKETNNVKCPKKKI